MYLNNRLSKFDQTRLSVPYVHFPMKYLKKCCIFCLCSKTQESWHNLHKLSQRYLQLPELTLAVAILGSWNTEDVSNILCNHIILLFKKFLCANKGSLAKLNSVSLKHYIKTFERIEQKKHIKRIS